MIEVSVIIPIYKSDLTDSETRSFKQCLQILGDHPLMLVAPNGLDTSIYENIAGRNLQCAYFNKRYFNSVRGYSELLLSKKFYCRFEAYEYILIYQLDAWVFRNDLSYWCKQNHDYVGAPWLEAPPIPSGKKPLINISNFLINKVGNGGLSLRKVKPHIRWAWWVSFIFKFFPKNEDILWTLLVPFKKPNAMEALQFAFELEPEQSYELTNGQLPFGCHAWEKYNPIFWKRFI
jgi:hypothetical protein